MSIILQNQDVKFNLKNKTKIKNWIKTVIAHYNKDLGDINYIFCSDSYILELNQQYLDHNYYTDIITFDYCENSFISGDIFISIDTVKSNSESFNTSFDHELLRVIIHGILHLIGFTDKTDEDQIKMRSLEDHAISLYLNHAN
ncbi:MAG: rRNA maturation RNase YbeY [Bacteroidales bacterium]